MRSRLLLGSAWWVRHVLVHFYEQERGKGPRRWRSRDYEIMVGAPHFREFPSEMRDERCGDEMQTDCTGD